MVPTLRHSCHAPRSPGRKHLRRHSNERGARSRWPRRQSHGIAKGGGGECSTQHPPSPRRVGTGRITARVSPYRRPENLVASRLGAKRSARCASRGDCSKPAHKPHNDENQQHRSKNTATDVHVNSPLLDRIEYQFDPSVRAVPYVVRCFDNCQAGRVFSDKCCRPEHDPLPRCRLPQPATMTRPRGTEAKARSYVRKRTVSTVSFAHSVSKAL